MATKTKTRTPQERLLMAVHRSDTEEIRRLVESEGGKILKANVVYNGGMRSIFAEAFSLENGTLKCLLDLADPVEYQELVFAARTGDLELLAKTAKSYVKHRLEERIDMELSRMDFRYGSLDKNVSDAVSRLKIGLDVEGRHLEALMRELKKT